MSRAVSSRNFAQYCTVGEAAQYLGVSSATLRNWDRSGKLKPRRHPQNGYRIYLHEELDAILRCADTGAATQKAGDFDFSGIRAGEHLVQFFDSDDFLADVIARFARAALESGGASMVVTTPEHRSMLEARLAVAGFDLEKGIAERRFVALDAAETLASLMIDGLPDERRFIQALAPMIEQAAGGRRLHIFGEMVALLWAAGNREAAIRLEQLWNERMQNREFVLLCAYPMRGFADAGDSFQGVCSCHGRVLPTEGYWSADEPQERLRVVAVLQQRADALAAEVAHRAEVERELRDSHRRQVTVFATLARELRKSLGSLRSALEIMQAQQEQGADGSLDTIQVELAQMVHVTDELLDAAMIRVHEQEA